MSKRIPSIIYLICLFWLHPFSAEAQNSFTLSISPTLFDVSAEPGQSLKSNLKIINVNDFDLTVYVAVVNFAASGEGGDGRFAPVLDRESSGETLAEWITISEEPVTIPREQSREIPFSVLIPKDAAPGGHFAAIMVGTRPLENKAGESRLQTAQMVTSLFFARVAGDVKESGLIREFKTLGSFLSTPEVDFILRFENRGNVHLKPQGDIKIFNMWGEERGIIPINQSSSFGNVLPLSIRQFTFTWKGEWSIADIGRYTAVATLGYGTDERQFSSSKTVFWIIPFTLIFWILVTLTILVGTMVYLVRRYVRHTLMAAGINIENYQSLKSKADKHANPAVQAPQEASVSVGLLNLKQALRSTLNTKDRLRLIVDTVYLHRFIILGIALIGFCITALAWYVVNANTKYRAFEVIYTDRGDATTVSSEEILYNEKRALLKDTLKPVNKDLPTIEIVNRTKIPGLGAEARISLEALGYTVERLSADSSTPQKRTVIVYSSDRYEEALELSQQLDSALISALEESASLNTIIVYVGSDSAAP